MIYAVLGVPRSGTSLVAGVLHHLGISMGDDLLPGDEWNPDGYFLDKPLLDIADGYASGDNTALANYLAHRKAGSKDFGIKEHRLYLLWSNLLAFGEPITIITTTRSHERSARSLAARNGMTEREAAAFLAPQRKAIDDILSQWRGRLLSVNFDALIEQPRAQVQRIADFIDRPLTDAAIAFIKPHYRRH